MTVVTGVTRQVRGSVAGALAARGIPFRMLVRDASRAPSLPGAAIVEDDARLTGWEPRTIRQVVELVAPRLPHSRKEQT